METASSEQECASCAPNWHAIFTRHQHEKSVASSLSGKGHEVYLPLYLSARRWRDRTKHLWLPLFPGYVFIRDGMDRQFQIVTTPGVIHIVSWGGRPAVVPQQQLNTVRRIIGSCHPVEVWPYLECGDRVRVKAGPLMGLEGLLARKKGISRLVVSMQILGRSVAVEIDGSNVERVGPYATSIAARSLAATA